MKKNNLLLLLAVVALAACSKNPYPGFDKTEDGLYYKFHVSGEGQKPAENDHALVFITYSDSSGQVYLDNRGQEPIYLPIFESTYPGDIYDALKMMSVGDSATFLLSMHDFFEITTGSKIPPEVDGEGILTFEIKLHDVKTQEQLVNNEFEQLANFLSENGIIKEPTESGLIFLENKRGRGPLATDGNRVKVHYKGTLLDGTVFDSSFDRDEPFEFQLGVDRVIQGWEEGLKLMNKGGSARFIIPSSIGYGSYDVGLIRPFSTLVFDVELIDIQ